MEEILKEAAEERSEATTAEVIVEQKKRKHPVLWILLALILIGVGVFIFVGQYGETDAEKFDAYVEELFLEEIVSNTINLHYTLAYPEDYGITDYEVSLGDYDPQGTAEAYDELRAMKKNLQTIKPSKLDKQQRLTYEILMDYADAELAVEDLQYYNEWLGAITGYQAQLPVILAEYTFRTEKDIQDYLELISQIDEMYQSVIRFEQEKAREGLFMADFAADDVIAQCEEFIKDPENNYMIDVFNDKIEDFEGISQQQKDDYIKENQDLITTQVVAGYQILIDGLTELKGTGVNDKGLCYFDRGKEYYEYLVKSKTGSEIPVKKLQKKAESFMMKRLYEVQQTITENPECYDEYLDFEFLTDPEEIVTDLMEKSRENFPEPPQVNHTIKYVHPSMEEHLSPAFYLTTPIDDLQNNSIYINQKFVDEGMDIYPTLAHEGYPGHLYQNACTNGSSLAPIRNIFSYAGYSEGWATYVEFEYAYDYAGMGEDAADVAAVNETLSLGICACIDMGVNYDGWTMEEVQEYLAGFGIEDEDAAEELYHAVIEDPANYLSYFIGYLEILDLRTAAQKKLGEAFDEKEFHRFMLEMGPAPFYIIEEHMEDWMSAFS